MTGNANEENRQHRTDTADEVVHFGNMVVKRGDGDRLQVSFGNRSYSVDEDIFEILVDHAVSEHRHVMDDRPHARWCDRRRHARVEAETLGPWAECIGREFVVRIGERDACGYWDEQTGSDGQALFILYWGPYMRELRLADLQVLRMVLSWLADDPLGQALERAVQQAISDYEDGIPAGEQP